MKVRKEAEAIIKENYPVFVEKILEELKKNEGKVEDFLDICPFYPLVDQFLEDDKEKNKITALIEEHGRLWVEIFRNLSPVRNKVDRRVQELLKVFPLRKYLKFWILFGHFVKTGDVEIRTFDPAVFWGSVIRLIEAFSFGKVWFYVPGEWEIIEERISQAVKLFKKKAGKVWRGNPLIYNFQRLVLAPKYVEDETMLSALVTPLEKEGIPLAVQNRRTGADEWLVNAPSHIGIFPNESWFTKVFDSDVLEEIKLAIYIRSSREERPCYILSFKHPIRFKIFKNLVYDWDSFFLVLESDGKFPAEAIVSKVIMVGSRVLYEGCSDGGELRRNLDKVVDTIINRFDEEKQKKIYLAVSKFLENPLLLGGALKEWNEYVPPSKLSKAILFFLKKELAKRNRKLAYLRQEDSLLF